MEQDADNPLVSTRPSDSGIHVSLHPLVLLTASDQITRSRVRGDKQPVVGILLGQQKGREVTAEHAFSAALRQGDDGAYGFKTDWIDTRIQQFRDVHKAPALDVVGWFTVASTFGPTPELVPFQRHITSFYTDSAILLTVHSSAFERSNSADQKLPITLFESVYETEATKDDTSMQIDGEESSALKFRPVPFAIETDEAEMIAINFVSKGAGSAAAVDDNASAPTTTTTQAEDKKGKKRASPDTTTDTKSPTPTALQETLTTEEQDQLANLTTRLNSVKMLSSRLHLLTSFIRAFPPSYLSDPSLPLIPASPDHTSLLHLRSIQALLTTLSLLTPASNTTTTASTITDNETKTLEAASLAQRNDVHLTQLLSSLNKDVQGLQQLGKTFATVENARSSGKRKGNLGGIGGDGFGGLGDVVGTVGGGGGMGGFQGPGGRGMLS